ncbi:hypothetical protein ACQP0C_27355 [Nocardia sp. CA-129566]|uniref:hypothetical protein n=1 Tax=Nocardia sp. CA-129566 TaxID=3239976 RepID=UPI003D988B1B
MVGVAFVSDVQAVVAEQPGDRPLDDPAVFAEFLAGFDASNFGISGSANSHNSSGTNRRESSSTTTDQPTQISQLQPRKTRYNAIADRVYTR